MNTKAKTSNPTVSVVIPSYNAEATLSETLLSVLSQSYSDWEVMVVDDGSCDATLSIALEYSNLDPRIQFLQQKNGGPSSARNNGLNRARGEFIAFLDADDTWRSDHLERALRLLNDDDQLGVAFAPCMIVGEDGQETGQFTRPSIGNLEPVQILAGNPTATCSSLVVRRSVFSDAGLMREDMVHAEDQEWLFRVVQSGWACRSHTACTVRYRCSPDGLSSNVQRMQEGWKMFVDLARCQAPLVVKKYLPRAAAAMHMYYFRRLVRGQSYTLTTMKHFLAAWSAAPMTACKLSMRMFASIAVSGARIGQLSSRGIRCHEPAKRRYVPLGAS